MNSHLYPKHKKKSQKHKNLNENYQFEQFGHKEPAELKRFRTVFSSNNGKYEANKILFF
jgi:hypothetical protein